MPHSSEVSSVDQLRLLWKRDQPSCPEDLLGFQVPHVPLLGTKATGRWYWRGPGPVKQLSAFVRVDFSVEEKPASNDKLNDILGEYACARGAFEKREISMPS
jgi:hypothetical protein